MQLLSSVCAFVCVFGGTGGGWVDGALKLVCAASSARQPANPPCSHVYTPTFLPCVVLPLRHAHRADNNGTLDPKEFEEFARQLMKNVGGG